MCTLKIDRSPETNLEERTCSECRPAGTSFSRPVWFATDSTASRAETDWTKKRRNYRLSSGRWQNFAWIQQSIVSHVACPWSACWLRFWIGRRSCGGSLHMIDLASVSSWRCRRRCCCRSSCFAACLSAGAVFGFRDGLRSFAGFVARMETGEPSAWRRRESLWRSRGTTWDSWSPSGRRSGKSRRPSSFGKGRESRHANWCRCLHPEFAQFASGCLPPANQAGWETRVAGAARSIRLCRIQFILGDSACSNWLNSKKADCLVTADLLIARPSCLSPRGAPESSNSLTSRRIGSGRGMWDRRGASDQENSSCTTTGLQFWNRKLQWNHYASPESTSALSAVACNSSERKMRVCN